MKTMIFCAAVGGLFALSTAATCHAAPLTRAEVAYCSEYADAQFRHAGADGFDAPDAAFEGAAEECEFQWRMLAAQWDEPAYLDQLAVLGIAAGTAEGMSYADAMREAAKHGSLGVEQVGAGLWAPIAGEACDQ